MSDPFLSLKLSEQPHSARRNFCLDIYKEESRKVYDLNSQGFLLMFPCIHKSPDVATLLCLSVGGHPTFSLGVCHYFLPSAC